jgi:putative nucleotidyltransferase with HDIG domain
MKKIRVKQSDLQQGMCVADDIYALNGILVAARNSFVDDRMIMLLKQYHISYVNVLRNDEEPGESRITAEQFRASVNKIQDDIKNTFEKAISIDEEIDTEEISQQMNALMKEAGNSYDLLNMLLDMGKESDSTYQHAIQVSLLSSVLGGWLGFSEKDVTLLGVAGLFHDIGKCKIDPQILNKKESLSKSEQEAVRQHAIIGYKIVQNRNIDGRVKQAVLSHHERCDGSGYPLKIKGNAIGEFPRIVAIADVYSAMTEKRPYRKRSYSPFETVGYLEREGVGKFDAKYMMCFLSKVLNSYLHRRVLLSNGITGEIIFINKANVSKPLIKTSTGYLDMSLTPELTVEEVL